MYSRMTDTRICSGADSVDDTFCVSSCSCSVSCSVQIAHLQDAFLQYSLSKVQSAVL